MLCIAGMSDEKGGTTPTIWAHYAPLLPTDVQEPNEQHQTKEGEAEDREEEEEVAYWDHRGK